MLPTGPKKSYPKFSRQLFSRWFTTMFIYTAHKQRTSKHRLRHSEIWLHKMCQKITLPFSKSNSPRVNPSHWNTEVLDLSSKDRSHGQWLWTCKRSPCQTHPIWGHCQDCMQKELGFVVIKQQIRQDGRQTLQEIFTLTLRPSSTKSF